jgi:phage gpG-like protein
MLRLRFSIEGEAQVSRVLQIAVDAATDLTPAWDRVVEDFHKAEAAQFGGQGVGPGGAWAPLSPAYAAYKSKKYGGKPVLQRSGRLYDSLTSKNEESVTDREPLSLTLGTRVAYAGYHQTGTRRMTRRKVIDLPEDFKRRAVRHVQRHLVDQIRKAGG